MRLRAIDSELEYVTTVDEMGTFSIAGLPAGKYSLSAVALALPENDSTIVVDRQNISITFCIDRAFRPAPADAVEKYKQKALADILHGKVIVYEWSPWSMTLDPYKKLNQRMKKKYGYEYEMVSCVRQQTREEIVQVKLWQAYKEVVYQHLAAVHGEDWKRKIKHEREKLVSK